MITEAVLCKDAENTAEVRYARNPFDGSRPCAVVLPLLLKSAIDSQPRIEVEQCLAVAVTHVYTGLDHGVGHFRPLSLTRQRRLLAYHDIAISHEGLCQVF